MKQLFGIIVAVLALAAGEAFAQGKAEILWLGQSALRITTPTGKVIMMDPWILNNPRTPQAWKNYDALGKLDLVLVTHGHGDHFPEAVPLVQKNNAPLWAPAGLAQALVTLGILPANLSNRMSQGGFITPFGPDGVKVIMVHAEHNSEFVWKNDATGKSDTHFGGEPCGYIVQLENGFKIYHPGDTGLFGDMKLIGEYYKPDLAFVPIGGGQFVMNPTDAAFAVREWIKPKYVIPFHYGANPAQKGTPEEFVKALGNTPTKVIVMNPGEKIEF